MMAMKLLICDDIPRRGNQAIEAIGRGTGDRVDAVGCFGKELTERLQEFYRNSVRGGLDGDGTDASVFDGFDIIIIDNNLSELELFGFRLTADVIMGHIRAFSTSLVVLALNASRGFDFDLLSLSPHSGGKADMQINTEHLPSNWLWFRSGETEESFRPWYWPKLTEAPQRREKQISELVELNQGVLEFFEFPAVSVSELSRRAVAGLHPEKRDLNRASVSFLDFFRRACVSLIEDERETLVRNQNWDAIRRIVAFELEGWLQEFVLGPQTVLVDLPHLLPRMPVLAGRRLGHVDEWTDIARKAKAPYGMARNIYQRHLKKYEFVRSHWLAVPAFWWGELRSDPELNDRLGRLAIEDIPDAAFCEDISTFVVRDGRQPAKFIAGFHSKWDQRYVKKIKGKKYLPADRLAR